MNTIAQHTPGPWVSVVPPSSMLTCRWIRGANGEMIALIGHLDYSAGQAADLANASLIAQAPAMEDFVRSCVAVLSVSGRHNSEERMADLAQRARAILRAVDAHTPGPWRADEYGNIIAVADSCSVAEACGMGHGFPPAEYVWRPDIVRPREANARLLAAAPELLAALERVSAEASHASDCYQRAHGANECSCYVADVEDAIRKATTP